MNRFLLTALVLTATIFVSAPTKAQEFTDAQKVEIKKMFDEHLANSGQQILDSVNKHQAAELERQQKEQNAKAAVFIEEVKKANTLAVAGNPEGDVTIVEFFDYNCGYCRKALEEVEKLIAMDDQVKVIFVDMPILGPQSAEAAKWSIAAANQGKYFEYHRAIMNFTGPKEPENLEKLAKDVGLDLKKLREDKDSEAVNEVIQGNLQKAQEMGIQGTPGFIIETEVTRGFVTADQMKASIAKIRNK